MMEGNFSLPRYCYAVGLDHVELYFYMVGLRSAIIVSWSSWEALHSFSQGPCRYIITVPDLFSKMCVQRNPGLPACRYSNKRRHLICCKTFQILQPMLCWRWDREPRPETTNGSRVPCNRQSTTNYLHYCSNDTFGPSVTLLICRRQRQYDEVEGILYSYFIFIFFLPCDAMVAGMQITCR